MPVVISGSTGISGTDGSAATPAIQGTDTNTGMYFPGNDRIAFAEGGVQVGEFDASANFLFNSGFGSVGIAYGCRAWVNFNGTGTVAIRGSGNVSSITDNGVGDYTLNFTNAMPDANYFVGGIAGRPGPNALSMLNVYPATGGGYSTGSMRIYTIASNGFNSGQGIGQNNLDVDFINVAIFR